MKKNQIQRDEQISDAITDLAETATQPATAISRDGHLSCMGGRDIQVPDAGSKHSAVLARRGRQKGKKASLKRQRD